MSKVRIIAVLALSMLSIQATRHPLPQQPGAFLAAGRFEQTKITKIVTGGGKGAMRIDQESEGKVTGTFAGRFTDVLEVVIRPDDTFSATFTLRVSSSRAGRRGTLELLAADVGRVTSPGKGRFKGVALITKAEGAFAGTRGMLTIEGKVDLATGLSSYTYRGRLRRPR